MTRAEPDPSQPFTWRDGERTILFGRGTVGEARNHLGPSYALITSERAAGQARSLAEAAGEVHHVAAGRVDELAGDLLDAVQAPELVAVGGGRVIDVAKAIAAARPPRRVIAVPTTLSAAEMTSLHRRARGAPPGAGGVRPALVIHDPALSASQPEPALAASAANSLGHAVEAPLTPHRNPVATIAAHRAGGLIANGLREAEPDRDALALGALLAGYAVGSGGYGLHHVVSQTLARFTPAGHAPANAAMLPHSIRALAERLPRELEALGEAMGEDPASVAERLAGRAGAERLRDLGVEEGQLEECAGAAADRGELALIPPTPTRDELLALYRGAW